MAQFLKISLMPGFHPKVNENERERVGIPRWLEMGEVVLNVLKTFKSVKCKSD